MFPKRTCIVHARIMGHMDENVGLSHKRSSDGRLEAPAKRGFQ